MNTERRTNERRNWKGVVFPYDLTFPDETEECQYCLTEKQAEILRGIVEPLGWSTRWFSDTQEIDQDTIETFRDDIIRRLMMPCCGGDFTIIYQWNEDGVLQQSTDGGTTWEDVPQEDPRNSSPVYPPVEGEPSDDKKCIAATGMIFIIKDQVGDQLTDVDSHASLQNLIETWVNTLLQTSNPFLAIINIAVNIILAVGAEVISAALTEEVYEQLKCYFLCHMQDDLSFTSEGWSAVRTDISDNIAGAAGLFLGQLVNLMGVVGLTNLARSQAATEGDCADCECTPSFCWELDFRVASDGVTAPLGSAYGLWVDGEGWQVPFHAGFNQLDAVFAFNWGTNINVTAIDFYGFSDTSNGRATSNGVSTFHTFTEDVEESFTLEYDGSPRLSIANQEWLDDGGGVGSGDLFYLRKIVIHSDDEITGMSIGSAC